MRAMGIDMGTTTISVIMIDGENGKLLGSRTIDHQAFLKGHAAFNRIQDPNRLWDLTEQAVCAMIQEYGKPESIGMTGQMHGMLYVDEKGAAVSPLYTWQDGSGNELLEAGVTYADYLRRSTGASATGYGLITHFYLQKNDMIPERAAKMCTISDYIAMKLCGLSEPQIARDMAASWGCFDIEKGDFYIRELEELGVNLSFLPQILPAHEIVGETTGRLPHGIPVAVSLGDNQASVLGSVRDLSDTVLVNIGTGSQVSFGTKKYFPAKGSIELRPCTEKIYLMAGSGLCGGRAYAMLEQFYHEVCGNFWNGNSCSSDLGSGDSNSSDLRSSNSNSSDLSSGNSGSSDSNNGGLHGSNTCRENLYDIMERQAREFLRSCGRDAAWKIRTTFSGTRSNPLERGNIQGIGVENFHPGAMTVGMITGILEELLEMYRQMCAMTGTAASKLVGSGNGIRRNPLMRELAEELFGMPMDIPVCQEEAAYGAALQSLAAAGKVQSFEEMQQKIRYIP
ncbi:FGGY family carbohydrate kinase [Blautia schinkii]|nr:FGGY family carbohydrate kinase [Blautia schinkii]